MATGRDLAALVDAANIICRRARIISGAFSVRIPLATHVSTSGGTVAVITDGAIAPNAAPFEAGELHPLWAKVGSWRYVHFKWGRQPLRPYMLEAAMSELDHAAIAYSKSATDYARLRGFR